MSPRPKVDHLRKPQIVAAAAEVIYQRGLLGARIGDIAKRAGTSGPTVLYYFESKDRLFEEVVDQSDREFYGRLTEGQALHERASDKLVHLIEETSRGPGGIADYTLWMELWVRARRDRTVQRNYFRLNRRERSLIVDIVKEGQAERRIQPGGRSRGIRVGAEWPDGWARGAGDARTTRRHPRADGGALSGARIWRAWLRASCRGER